MGPFDAPPATCPGLPLIVHYQILQDASPCPDRHAAALRPEFRGAVLFNRHSLRAVSDHLGIVHVHVHAHQIVKIAFFGIGIFIPLFACKPVDQILLLGVFIPVCPGKMRMIPCKFGILPLTVEGP